MSTWSTTITARPVRRPSLPSDSARFNDDGGHFSEGTADLAMPSLRSDGGVFIFLPGKGGDISKHPKVTDQALALTAAAALALAHP